jgi:hypothetical protein
MGSGEDAVYETALCNAPVCSKTGKQRKGFQSPQQILTNCGETHSTSMSRCSKLDSFGGLENGVGMR